MRALEPTTTGHAINPHDGVRTYYEVFGPVDATRSILCVPAWALVYSRIWKMQVPYFARRGYRVITFDPRGNGKSERPGNGFTTDDFTQDALAVLDTVACDRAAVCALSAGTRWAIQLAARHPERVSQLVLIGPTTRLDGEARFDLDRFFSDPPDRQGWNKYNAIHWREDYRDFVEWFVGSVFTEPHSTKPFDDFVSWALETDAETLIATIVESPTPGAAEMAAGITCPTLIIQGVEDQIIPFENGCQIHTAIRDSQFVAIEGGGHAPNVRDPVKTNLLIHEFLTRREVQRARA